MTILQIKYFLTIAQTLSFTKAAEQLYISQPALSRYIRNMEEELNLQIFVRTPNGIRLTPAGSSLYVGFLDLYNHYVEITENAQKVQKGLSGSLKIGILNHANVSDFMPLIYQYFKKTHPNVDLAFYDESFDKLTTGLYSGKLDMVFTLQFEIANKESLVYQYVERSKDHIVMSKYHPLATKEKITFKDLKNETFIFSSPDDNPENSALILALCKDNGFVPQAIYAKTLSELILWVSVGKGITVLDSRCSFLFNDNIKYFEFESNWDPSLVVAWNQNNFNPLISVFLKKMDEILKLENEDIHGLSID